MQICASSNHRKAKKTESCRLIPQRQAAQLKLSLVGFVLCFSLTTRLNSTIVMTSLIWGHSSATLTVMHDQADISWVHASSSEAEPVKQKRDFFWHRLVFDETKKRLASGCHSAFHTRFPLGRSAANLVVGVLPLWCNDWRHRSLSTAHDHAVWNGRGVFPGISKTNESWPSVSGNCVKPGIVQQQL